MLLYTYIAYLAHVILKKHLLFTKKNESCDLCGRLTEAACFYSVTGAESLILYEYTWWRISYLTVGSLRVSCSMKWLLNHLVAYYIDVLR